MESRESTPFKAWLSTGTPSTGSSVFAATIPGRCAAPPAPAMITCRPRLSADSAYSTIHCGVRCADTIFVSCGTPNCVSVSAAWRIVSQSDLLPMMMPATGVIAELLSLRERVTRLSVVAAQRLRLDNLQALFEHAPQQR